MPEYVEVVVNLPKVQGKFHYHVPLALSGQVQPGSLVVAPFGAQQVQGVVLRAIATPQVAETRGIEGLLDQGTYPGS